MIVDTNRTTRSELKPGWRTVRFGEVVRDVKVTVDPEQSGLERYIAGEHMDTDDLHIRRWGTIGDGYLGPAFHRKFVSGQVLYGSRRTYLRKVAVADFDGICANTTFVLEPLNDELIPELLPFIMQTESFVKHSMQQSRGSTNPYVTFKDLAWYEFALPPRDEQRRIAEILWAADEAVQALERSLNAANHFQDAALLTMLTRGVGNKSHSFKESKFGQVPSHWRICPISDVAEVEYGISEAVSGNTDPSIGWPILTNANITLDGEFDLSKLNYIEPPKKDSFVLKKGDLLLVWRSGSPEHVGKTAIFDLDQPFTHASFLLRIRAGKDINNVFLHRLLNFMRRRELFKADTSQQVNFKMNASVFREIPVIVPPHDEQEEMLELFVSMETARDAIINRINTSKNLQKQLLSEFLTGSVSK